MMEFVQELGGGPLALALVILGFLCWTILQWWKVSVEDRIKAADSYSSALREIQKDSLETLNTVTVAVRELTVEVKRNAK